MKEHSELAMIGWNLAKVPNFWFNPCGSLLVARSKEEIEVLEELVSSKQDIEGLRLLTPMEALKKSPGLAQEGLLGALWSESEICVIPRRQSKRFLYGSRPVVSISKIQRK